MLMIFYLLIIWVNKYLPFIHFYFQAYVRMIKCCLILGDILEAETALKKLSEFDPNNESILTEQKDVVYVKKFLKDADAAYNSNDYRKVKSSSW